MHFFAGNRKVKEQNLRRTRCLHFSHNASKFYDGTELA
jgi:hypothetical protein